ncbi:MAG: dTMP kinase [Bacillota bacterium]|nr:dTMP kinase [Bacillota bacterium]
MNRGFFITFEGGDGSGKSTQIQKLKEYLQSKGMDVILTREPGGTAISEKIREIILDPDNAEMSDQTEMMLYAAARAQLVNEVIEPVLNSGKSVICDRFVDSSMAYQAYGRGLGDMVWEVNQKAIGNCMPDLTILLKLDPDQGKNRISNRQQDRIEQASSDFHRKVYEGYLALEQRFPQRIKGIDASRDIEDIFKEIKDMVDDLMSRTV